MERMTTELDSYFSPYLLPFAPFISGRVHFFKGILCTGELDKFKSRNYFFDRNKKKGVMKYGMGINHLEALQGTGPF